MEIFRKVHNDFNYLYQIKLQPSTTTIVPLPKPTGKAKSVKSISWTANNTVTASATISSVPAHSTTVWEEMRNGTQLSPAVTAIKFVVNNKDYGNVCVRVIME